MLDHGSFHGRGFVPGGIALDDPLAILAAFGGFVGLLIARHLYRRPHESRLFGKEGCAEGAPRCHSSRSKACWLSNQSAKGERS